MSKRLENKVVIITGASKGMGAGIAKLMGAEGAKVVVNYASSKIDADKVVSEITNNGGTAIAIQGDITKSEDVKRLFEDTKKAFGNLDVLVNNAGVYNFAPLGGITEDSYRKTYDLNVWGLILTSQEAVKMFGENGGSIINISAALTRGPEAYQLIYASSKNAVNSITISLAQELGPKNIRINAILPGPVMTEGAKKMHASGLVKAEDVTKGGTSEVSDMGKKMISRTALGRIGMPEDIANMAVFLASDQANFVTGQLIDLSGGFK
jgi:3-oxoacyl-[acyl-carrier protein] reductase